MRKKNSFHNLFAMIPSKMRDDEIQDDQTIHVLYPRFPCWPFRWLMKYVKKPFIHLKLDVTGSRIWEAIDGEKTVLDISVQIGQLLEKEITENWHGQVATYIKYLQCGDLIRLRAKQPDL